jgi:hypothetical protein
MIEYQLIRNVRRYSDIPDGAQVLMVNGRESIGICEACGFPVLEGQLLDAYEDGLVHHKCSAEARRKTEEGRQHE